MSGRGRAARDVALIEELHGAWSDLAGNAPDADASPAPEMAELVGRLKRLVQPYPMAELRRDRNVLSLAGGVPTDVPTIEDVADLARRLGREVE